jgi:hypothetical protein
MIRLRNRYQFEFLLVLEQLFGDAFFKMARLRWKQRLLRKLEADLGNTPASRGSLQVERVQDLAPEDFVANYLHGDRAVIFSGAAKDWQCCQKWSLDYFEKIVGGEDVLLAGARGLTQPANQQEVSVEWLALKNLIHNIRAGGEKYLRFSPLVEKNKTLSSDLDHEWLAAMKGPKTFGHTHYLFMGGQGRKTFLHSDLPCNLFVQVTGEKKWTLYNVKDTPLVYPSVTNTAYVKSEISSDDFSSTAFPLFKYAQSIEAHLKPGDILYVPPYMWHEVENLTESIAVGYRFTSFKLASVSKTFLLLRLLVTNPPVWKTGPLGKIDTNLIWAFTAGKLSEALSKRPHA